MRWGQGRSPAVVIIHIISLELLVKYLYLYYCTTEGGHEISLRKINVNMICQADHDHAIMIKRLNILTEKRDNTTVRL
jgi:hypothetical protein